MVQVHTKFGTFPVKRRGTVAFSIVESKGGCRHKGRLLKPGDLTIIEHRKVPAQACAARFVAMGWARWLATYDLEGRLLFSDSAVETKAPKAQVRRAYPSADAGD